MISIIIASANEKLLQDVKTSIEKTIGVVYEVIAFQNSIDARGICEIYNEGIKLAKYDTLCLMHEDVAFETVNWGKIVLGIFQNHPALGLLGIAGSSYKSLTPSGWLIVSDVEPQYINFLQSYKYTDRQPDYHYKNADNQALAQVVAIDGVWMCTRKEVAEKAGFDSNTFRGFHCYDVDFCLSVRRYGYATAVTFNVLLQHFSEGKLDCDWLTDTIKLHHKWDAYLPQATKKFTPFERYTLERQNFKYFVKKLLLYKFPLKTAFHLIWKDHYRKKLGLKLFIKFHYYLLRFSIWDKPKKSVR